MERWWTVDGQDIGPRLDYEDEDHGAWAEIACGQCRGRVTGALRDRVLSRLLGAA